MTNFEAVVQYYFPGQEEFIRGKMASFASDILAEEDHKLLLEGWVAESKPDLDTEVTLSLLYRGSRDGFGAADFHAKCDDKGDTVTIVKSTEGYIFGGYSDQSWKSNGYDCYKSSSCAFLFSIVNPAGIAPMKLHLTLEIMIKRCAAVPLVAPCLVGEEMISVYVTSATLRRTPPLIWDTLTPSLLFSTETHFWQNLFPSWWRRSRCSQCSSSRSD
jgi:hypothetical protein